MSFASARAYLMGTINETVSRHVPYRLERMTELLRALGDPQSKYPTVHVGGTSGKGSTSTMIAAALGVDGRRVGLHTKPHLSSMTERMRINGRPIAEDAFADLFFELRPIFDRVAGVVGRPSYYETLLALAFEHFAREEVEVAVIEVGLGGTLDGTNVIVPRVSVITNIGLDHTDVLGERLIDIATDKAGIAKRTIPLVSDVVDPGARAVIERHCAQAGAPFHSVWDEVVVEPREGELYGQHFLVRTPEAQYDLSLPILGAFQRRNAATAIRALEFVGSDLRPSVDQVERGFSQLMIPGRMEFFPSHPSVVFDIAHNPDKAKNVVDALLETFADRRFVTVLAIGESKDAAGVIAEFARLPGLLIFTAFETAGRRSIKPSRLASIAEAAGRGARSVSDPVEAFSIARRQASASDVVVISGSTFLVATLRDWWFANVAAARS